MKCCRNTSSSELSFLRQPQNFCVDSKAQSSNQDCDRTVTTSAAVTHSTLFDIDMLSRRENIVPNSEDEFLLVTVTLKVNWVICNGNASEKERFRARKRSNYINLFLDAGTLEYVSIDLLGELAETTQSNRNMLAFTDRFNKLLMPLRNTSTIHIFREFFRNWVNV